MTAFTSKSTRTSKALAGATALSAATLLAIGAAAPAMADDSTSTELRGFAGDSALSSELLKDLTTDIGISDLLDDTVDGGDVNGGDISIGDLGGDLVAPIAPEVGDIGSGNAVGSGNDVNAPVGSGNSVDVGDITGDISDVVDVNDIVDDVTGSVDVDGLVGDVTGSISTLLD